MLLMKYRNDKYNNQISILGYGCMRFTEKGGKVDLDKATSEIKAAFDLGVNYFDTAYSYKGNEVALGEILKRLGIRDKINIATKMPQYLVKKSEDFDRFFDEELRRLQTDHVDYYLIHMLTDLSQWERMCELGIVDWIKDRKERGQIRQIGFSYHGNPEMFLKIVDAYEWEFCQIQYNYLDENAQAGRVGLMHANSKGLPVIIMEPLRGGRLVNNLPKAAVKAFNEAGVKRSPQEWGLKWLWDQEEVTCVLSGMNDMTQITENCKWASESEPGCFSTEDHAVIKEVVRAISEREKVPCTACRYCMPCPMGVDIPTIFAAYNRFYTDSKFIGLKDYCTVTVLREDSPGPVKCIGCNKCVSHCPQHINIPVELKKARRTMEFPGYGLLKFGAKKVLKY